MVDLKPGEKIESVRRGQEVLADLLLVASPDAKAGVRKVREAIGAARSQSMLELAKLTQELKAGRLDHLKESEIEFFANVWFPAHFWDKVWPAAEELADVMSNELGA